jgi:hypothetical protein
LVLAGFEPPKGVGKGFSHVVGVTRASRASEARGAEPLWKFASANLGSNPALSAIFYLTFRWIKNGETSPTKFGEADPLHLNRHRYSS